MGTIKLEEILEATGGRLISKGADEFSAVSIDSRTLRGGEIFFALKGDRFDGNDFALKALEKSAAGAVISRDMEIADRKSLILVEDPLRALQALARRRRLKKDIPVIGVTGSNGKTTTKEMLASILGVGKNTLKNAGNLNNQIGLPLSLTGLNSVHEAAVLEMGASLPGDIKELCEIASPTHGVFTNIGSAHLEGFGTKEALRDTKLELLDFAEVVAVNADDEYLMEGLRKSGYKGKVVLYAIKNKQNADVYADDISLGERDSSFTLHSNGGSIGVSLKTSGLFNIYNALAASSIALAVGHSQSDTLGDIKAGLDAFAGVAMRFGVRSFNGLTVIGDVYNANPDSVKEALRELKRLSGRISGQGRAVAVLGDMLELGPYAEEAHKKIGALMNELGIGLFIAVGPLMALAAEAFGGEKRLAKSAKEAGEMLLKDKIDGDAVLIKGSRGMRMEEVLPDAL